MSCKYNNCKVCGYKSECEIFKENAELKSKEYFVGNINRQNMELQQKLEAKEEQIEKMKCCQNCKHHYFMGNDLECKLIDCDNKESWELAK